MTFFLSRGYALSLKFTGYTDELYLQKGSWRQKLGWMDLAHPFPDVFRWPEFEQIVVDAASATANLNRSQIHGLLTNFLSISAADKPAQIRKVIKQQLNGLNLFSQRDIANFSQWVGRDMDFVNEIVWEQSHKLGWLQVGEGYSMRSPGFEKDFDFDDFTRFVRFYQ